MVLLEGDLNYIVRPWLKEAKKVVYNSGRVSRRTLKTKKDNEPHRVTQAWASDKGLSFAPIPGAHTMVWCHSLRFIPVWVGECVKHVLMGWADHYNQAISGKGAHSLSQRHPSQRHMCIQGAWSFTIWEWSMILYRGWNQVWWNFVGVHGIHIKTIKQMLRNSYFWNRLIEHKF